MKEGACSRSPRSSTSSTPSSTPNASGSIWKQRGADYGLSQLARGLDSATLLESLRPTRTRVVDLDEALDVFEDPATARQRAARREAFLDGVVEFAIRAGALVDGETAEA